MRLLRVDDAERLGREVGPVKVSVSRAAEGDKASCVFNGGVLDGEWLVQISPDPAELTGFGFHGVDAIAEATIARLARRITHAVAARAEGTAVYLENGRPALGVG